MLFYKDDNNNIGNIGRIPYCNTYPNTNNNNNNSYNMQNNFKTKRYDE